MAEEQHFGHAAQKLGITPPTLTVQIQNLEYSLDTALLVRKGKKISLSDAGQRFLVEARATLKQAERVERIAREAGRGEIAKISISFILAAAMSGTISEAINIYSKQYPGVSFKAQRLETIQGLRALIAKDIDVAIVRAPIRYPSELTGFSLSSDLFWAALPSGHPLTKRKSLSLSDLAGEPYIASMLETELGLRGNIAEISSNALPVVSDAPAAEIVSVLVLVAAKLGISVVSTPVTRVAMPNVVYRPMRGLKDGGELVVVYRSAEESLAVKRFVGTLKKLAR